MIDARWHEYPTSAAMAEAVAAAAGLLIQEAVGASGRALIALPGGTTPAAAFERLARTAQPWSQVTIIPTDDRLVASDHPLSNSRLIAGKFGNTGARLVSLILKEQDHREAGDVADRRLFELPWPPDLVWLGVGADGHTASIFPGPDFEAALNEFTSRRAMGVMPDPLPPEAPVARVTLTAATIRAARRLMLTATGNDKRDVLDRALAEGRSSPLPVGRVLCGMAAPIDIHWSPK